MKSTFSHLSKWAKVTSVFLCLFLAGIGSISAQNYKPLNEAVYSVRLAITELPPANARPTTGPATNKASVMKGPNISGFNREYFTAFVQNAQRVNSVAEVVAKVDQLFPVSTTPEPRKTLISQARSELMQLITE